MASCLHSNIGRNTYPIEALDIQSCSHGQDFAGRSATFKMNQDSLCKNERLGTKSEELKVRGTSISLAIKKEGSRIYHAIRQ